MQNEIEKNAIFGLMGFGLMGFGPMGFGLMGFGLMGFGLMGSNPTKYPELNFALSSH